MSLIKFCKITDRSTLQFMSDYAVEFAGYHAIDSLDSEKLDPIAQLIAFSKSLPNPPKAVLLTKLIDISLIVSSVSATNPDLVQLHTFWTTESLWELRKQLNINGFSAIKLLTVFDPILHNARIINDIVARSPADYFILDHQQGGTGKRLPVETITEILSITGSERTFIAGGLNSTNVTEVITKFRPYCVDVQSGIRESMNDVPSIELMRRFIDAARAMRPRTI